MTDRPKIEGWLVSYASMAEGGTFLVQPWVIDPESPRWRPAPKRSGVFLDVTKKGLYFIRQDLLERSLETSALW